MSAVELVEWRAFAAMEPFGEAQADHRAGVQASLLANINRNSKTRPDPFKVTDFFPDRTLTPAEQAQVDEAQHQGKLLHMAALLNAALGGTDRRPRPNADENGTRPAGA